MQKALWEPPKINNWSFLFLKATLNSGNCCNEDEQQHQVRKKVDICQILNAKHFLNQKKATSIPK